MEAREEVEQTSDVAKLQDCLNRNRKAQGSLFARLSKCLHEHDLADAKNAATELIYLDRLEQAILEKLPTAA